MNTAERVIGTAVTLSRVGRVIAERKVRRRSDTDASNPVFLLMFQDYYKLLGIQESRGKIEALGIAGFGLVVANYTFWCDSYLDSQPLGTKEPDENFYYKGITHKECLERVEHQAKKLVIPPDKINKILDLFADFRKKVWVAHWSFFPEFDPSRTSFDQIMNYADVTTGATADVLIHVLGIAGNVPQVRIEQAAATGRQQANAFQMTDDLVDCVGDLGRRINLFNALLLKRLEELKTFSEATRRQEVLGKYRPFQIATIYAPNSINDYMQRFDAMIKDLPLHQKHISKGLMATGTFMSFTPQSETSFSPISLFLPKTKVDD